MKASLTFIFILLCFFNAQSQVSREALPFGVNSDGRLISVFEESQEQNQRK